MTKIVKFSVDDVRFPTSNDLTGSDAVHTDPDYSATYVTVYTSDEKLKGYGIAFTIGKGNDIVADCIKHFFPIFVGMIGGIIGYLIIRKDDPRRAKNCIYIGIVMMLIGIIFNIMLLGVDVVGNPGFNVNV